MDLDTFEAILCILDCFDFKTAFFFYKILVVFKIIN